MKVTRYGPNGLPLPLAGWSSGYVSIGSNSDTNPPLSSLNFVQRITANSSNVLLNPIVNFASGSNILLTLDQGPLPTQAYPSNTIRIHSTGGGGGTISAGSNSTQVREISTAGASTTLWSPFDHAHDGIGTITSSSSNTMQRGTWNIRAGSGIALSLTDTDGDGEFDTTTIVNTGSGGGGSSSLTTSYLGYNTVGGSQEAMTGNRMYAKKITAGASGNTLLGMGAYVDQTSEAIILFLWALFADNAGAIGDLITAHYVTNVVLAHGTAGTVSFPARWLHVPMAFPLAASTSYWVGIEANGTSGGPRLYYDTSGSDRYMPMGSSPYISDGGYTGVGTQTDSTRKYSIRALVI